MFVAYFANILVVVRGMKAARWGPVQAGSGTGASGAREHLEQAVQGAGDAAKLRLDSDSRRRKIAERSSLGRAVRCLLGAKRDRADDLKIRHGLQGSLGGMQGALAAMLRSLSRN